MSNIFVIGDVQGCHDALARLLELGTERLGSIQPIFVGDLINRGPDSMAVLERVRSHDYSTVLGNHELYVLGVASGAMRRKSDTLDDFFSRPDFTQWVEWLRHRPLHLRIGNNLIVHAGVHPMWSVHEFQAHVDALEAGLRSDNWAGFVRDVLGKNARQTELTEALGVLTRMRMLGPDGKMDHDFKGPPELAPPPLKSWFEDYDGSLGRIIFGHWAALGAQRFEHCVALDSGCVWGRELTGICLDSDQLIAVPSIVKTVR